MPLKIPCPQAIRDCECTNDPISNYSSEDPDQPVCFGHYTQPATAGTFFVPGCFGDCEVVITSTEEQCASLAEECAAREAIECPPDPPDDPPDNPDPPVFPPRTIYTNQQQTCTVECPDGTTFGWTVPVGTFKSFWQADANARASGLACKLARRNRVCFTTDSPLTPICTGESSTIVIGASGGTPDYTFALESGSIPAGMTFDPVGLIQGTPTTGGTSTFTIRVTDAIGSFQTKEFVLRVVEITSPEALPDATLNSAYSETILATGTSGTVVWSLVSGSLPTGLSLSTDGVISGTPTEADLFTFTLALLDGTGASCSKEFEIDVIGTVSLLSYWTFDDYVINSLILDSTANSFDLSYNTVDGTILAGKVGNCFRPNNPTDLQCFTGDFSLFNNANDTGFTVCGWVQLNPADATGDGLVCFFSWSAPGSDFGLHLLNADLILEINGDGVEFEQIVYPFPQDGGWHFYRAWYDPTDNIARLQLDNGTIMASAVIPVASGNGNQVKFAGNASFAGSTERYLDETGFWKRPLSNSEALSLWNGGAGTTFPLLPP